MKIIDTDNFGGDYPDERVIAEGIKVRLYADVMCAGLNAQLCTQLRGSRFYRVVEDDYVLQPGFEP